MTDAMTEQPPKVELTIMKADDPDLPEAVFQAVAHTMGQGEMIGRGISGSAARWCCSP